MAVLVQIPAALQKWTRQQSEVHAEGSTVQAVLADLERCFPGMQAQLCDNQGAIRKFINLYVNDEDIRFLDGTQTAVKDGDELAIIPAVAGGSGGIDL
jgi:sulfur-carrier protein